MSAAVSLRVADYYTQGPRSFFRLHEKGGRYNVVPAHHIAQAYVDAARIGADRRGPLSVVIGGRAARRLRSVDSLARVASHRAPGERLHRICGSVPHTADRDVNAAANALRWARTNGAVPAPGGFNREVSARRRETRAPQCPVPPESLGSEAALARREPGKLPGQRSRQDCCPRPNPQEFCPSGQISC